MARPNLCYSNLVLGNESGFAVIMKYFSFGTALMLMLFFILLTPLFGCLLPLNHKKKKSRF